MAQCALAGCVAALLFACDTGAADSPRGAPPPSAIASATPHSAGSAGDAPAKSAPGASRNRLMGAGEVREPEPFTMEQRLLAAVSRNDRATIERALERGATVQSKDDLQRGTVLLAVLDAGSLELARWLHERGAPLDEPDVGGRTALSYAAEAGRLDIVRYLVENGAAVDRRDVQKRTPLFQAALTNRIDVLDFLLDRGAQVDVRDQFGDTPLIVACAKGNAEAAALLLRRGADPSLKDQEGRTARERAAPGTAPCSAAPTAAPAS